MEKHHRPKATHPPVPDPESYVPPDEGSSVAVADEPYTYSREPESAPPDAPPAEGSKAPTVNPLATGPVVSPLWSPAAGKQPTQFYNPVVVTAPGFVAGVALLAYRFELDFSAGNFTGGTAVPGSVLTFPPGSILWKILSSVTTAFNGTTPTVSFGTTSGGTQLGTIALTPVGNAEAPTSPAVLGPLANSQVFVTAAMGGATAGHASIAILYLGRPAAPWA